MKRDPWTKLLLSSVLGLAMGLTALPPGAAEGAVPDAGQQGQGPGPGGGQGPAGSTGGSNKTIPPKKLQAIHDTFETSLHRTRMGKKRFYSAFWDIDGDGVLDDNGGFQHSVEAIYDMATADYENLACKDCHYGPAVNAGLTDAEFPGDCTDCHWNFDAGDYGVPAYEIELCFEGSAIVACPDDESAVPITQDQVCLGCHGRQGAEHNLLTDVHRAIDANNPGGMPKFRCMGCHQMTEVHGDGIAYESHLDAPKTSCAQSGCHERELKLVKGKKATGGACKGGEGGVNERCKTFHAQHLADVDCTACHVQSNTSCNSCHFDSELEHNKRFYRQIPAKGFTFLMNFADIQTGASKVRTATYQSLTVGAVCSGEPEARVCETDDVETFAVFAPYAAHAVTRAEALSCSDCHVAGNAVDGYEGNPALARYLTEGTVKTTTWNTETSLLEGPTGIIPLPHDWAPDNGGALEMDFVYYLGDTTDPVTKNPAGDQWAFLRTGPDRGHTPYGSPLSEEQIERLILESLPDE